MRGFLTIGLCGGFTTFSTFDFETLSLLDHGHYVLAATYSLGSVVTCILGVLAGIRIAAFIECRSARCRIATPSA